MTLSTGMSRAAADHAQNKSAASLVTMVR